MEKYYQLNLYKGEPLKINTTQKNSIETATTSLLPPEFIKVGDEMVSVRNIAGIEETTQPAYPLKQLPGETVKPQPTYTDEGVRAIWAKKRVTDKQYDKLYAGRSGYYRLNSDDLDIWVAFTYVPTGALPLHLQEVSKSEFSYLESRAGSND